MTKSYPQGGANIPPDSAEKQGISPPGGAESGTVGDGSDEMEASARPGTAVPSDRELARLVEAWRALPVHVKAAILALVNTVGS